MAFITHIAYECRFFESGAKTPPPTLRLASGTTSSSSNSMWLPRPVQTGQAPYGLLNENMRGVISGRLMPQSTQAKFSLNIRSSPPTICT